MPAMRSLIALAACACSPPSPHCRDRIAPGELVVSELFADYKPPPGAGGGDVGHQWFELYNASDRMLDLSGVELVHTRASGTVGKHRVAELAVPPHQYTTLGDEAPGALASYLDYGYGDELGAFDDGGGGTLSVRCDGDEIAMFAYDASHAGHARELTGAAPPTAMLASDPASWCDAAADEFEPANFGTPRAPSDCIPPAQCRDGGSARAIVPPAAGQLAITEVMPSPTVVPDATGEWIETLALADVDLNGIALDRVRDARTPDLVESDSCLHVAAGDYVVFGKSTDPVANGGLPALAGMFRFALVAGTASAPGDARILVGATVIDAVEWTRSSEGAALQRDSANRWCDATAAYGAGDLGSPGAPNGTCP
jgi:hypothetical protein